MDKQKNIFGLGEDILYLILKQVENDSPASLLQFAKASKECENLANPILYRMVTLSDKGSEKDLLRMKRLLERLLNRDDSIHDYVKELKIIEWGKEVDHLRPCITMAQARANPQSLNFRWDTSSVRNGESEILPSSKLKVVMQNLRNLEAFSWDAMSMIPEEVILKLEETRPCARLSVNNTRRNEKTADSTMDIRLLSSPLLHSLSYSIFYASTSGDMTCSEFRKLKEILVQSPKLKVLSLGIYDSPVTDMDVPKTTDDWHPYLPVGSGAPLVNLHGIKMLDQHWFYAIPLSKVYSAIFAQSNNFTHLVRLDFINVCGHYSFEALKGRVSNLKDLELSFKAENQASRNAYDSPTLIVDFIESIDALEAVKIQNYEASFDLLWGAILKHRSSLKRLAIHTVPDQTYRRKAPPVFTCDQMEQLQESKISNLALDVLIPDLAWYSKSDHGLNNVDLNPSIALALANFTNVEILKLYVEVPIEATIFAIQYHYNPINEDVPVPPVIEEKAKEVAIGLYEQIFITDPKAALRALEICFCRLNIGDRMDSFIVHNSIWVRKVEIDYINDPNAPGYEVECQGEWVYQPHG